MISRSGRVNRGRMTPAALKGFLQTNNIPFPWKNKRPTKKSGNAAGDRRSAPLAPGRTGMKRRRIPAPSAMKRRLQAPDRKEVCPARRRKKRNRPPLRSPETAPFIAPATSRSAPRRADVPPPDFLAPTCRGEKRSCESRRSSRRGPILRRPPSDGQFSSVSASAAYAPVVGR